MEDRNYTKEEVLMIRKEERARTIVDMANGSMLTIALGMAAVGLYGLKQQIDVWRATKLVKAAVLQKMNEETEAVE